MTQGTGGNQQKKKFWAEENTSSGAVQNKVQMWTRLRCFSMTEKKAIHSRHPQNIAELKHFCEQKWCKVDCLCRSSLKERFGPARHEIQGFTYLSNLALWMCTQCFQWKHVRVWLFVCYLSSLDFDHTIHYISKCSCTCSCSTFPL